jgi:hypothetical protein
MREEKIERENKESEVRERKLTQHPLCPLGRRI